MKRKEKKRNEMKRQRNEMKSHQRNPCQSPLPNPLPEPPARTPPPSPPPKKTPGKGRRKASRSDQFSSDRFITTRRHQRGWGGVGMKDLAFSFLAIYLRLLSPTDRATGFSLSASSYRATKDRIGFRVP